MKVDFVRKVDYWLGIPICFILSIFYGIQKKIISRKIVDKIEPKKIIFLKPSEMGSVILTYPAIRKAKEIYPNAVLYFWIFKENKDVIHILNIIPKENVITMRNENFLLLIIDIVKNLWRIWKEKIDVVIDMELFSRFTSVLSYLTGAPVRVGFYNFSSEGLYRGNMHTKKVAYNSHKHIATNFLSLVYSLEASDDEVPMPKKKLDEFMPFLPKIESSKEAEKDIWDKLKAVNKMIAKDNEIVLLNPGSSQLLPLRKWPIENYVKLANMFSNEKNIFIVIIGIKDDALWKKRVIRAVENDRCIDLTGRTTLRGLIDLFNISQLLISHDSGPPNFAALTGINMIVLFGPETPNLYAPLSDSKTILYANFACSPCVSAYSHRRSLCKDNKCLQAISVEEVYNTAKKILGDRLG